MMQARELRIGNYIYKNGIEEEVKHLKVKVNHLQAEGGFLDELVNNVLVNGGYDPIPLTEEWLFKFGFEKSKEGRVYLNEDFYFENGQLWIGAPDGQFWRKVICPGECKYVHQLQNLFFALCGKELTVTDPAI